MRLVTGHDHRQSGSGVFKDLTIFKYKIVLLLIKIHIKNRNDKHEHHAGACLDTFQKGFTNFFVLNLPLKYAYLRYALPVKYALCVLRNIYPKKSVFKMLFTA